MSELFNPFTDAVVLHGEAELTEDGWRAVDGYWERDIHAGGVERMVPVFWVRSSVYADAQGAAS